jgi:alkylhydroperoxidase family enzyme
VSEADPPRLQPIPAGDWTDEMRAALSAAFPAETAARLLSSGPDAIPMPNALATFMHHPALTGPFLAYNNVLLAKPALGHRERELVVLRVAWRTRARYEWVQHLRLAPRYGITAEEIAAIADGPEAPTVTPLETELLAATDQLIDNYRVDDDTWARLAGLLDETRLVELVFVVGTYTALAMAFNSFGLQLDPELQELAASSPDVPHDPELRSKQ